VKTYTYSEARNRLAEVLEESRMRKVIIRRRRWDSFTIVPRARSRRSPFDVPGVGNGIARRELLSALRETRTRRVSPSR